MGTNKDTLSKILHIIITILTALAATLTTQSCMKHKASPSNLPDSYPITAITALADMPATQTGVAVITWLSAEDWRLLQQLIEHERECNALHSSDTEWKVSADTNVVMGQALFSHSVTAVPRPRQKRSASVARGILTFSQSAVPELPPRTE